MSVVDTPLLLTERQACERLQVSRKVLYGLRKSREIGYVPIGTGIRYTPDQLDAWIAKARKDATNG